MRGGTSRLALPVVVILLLAAGVWWTRESGSQPAKSPQPPPAKPSTATAAPAPSLAPDGPKTAQRREKSSERDPVAELEASAWDRVDMKAVRAALPDNVYWMMSVPTDDPAVLQAREEERDRWNVEYGKVLSSTATAEEIEAYYAHRKRLSSDYIAFAGHLLSNYGTQLPKRDVSLLKLAIDMHLARLEEIPRQIVEAHERREAHDAARRAWLADQAAFEGEHATPP